MYIIIESTWIDCPWCKKAKQYASNYNKDHSVISLEIEEQKFLLIDILNKYFNINEKNIHQKTGCSHFTFPQIFYVKSQSSNNCDLNNLHDFINLLNENSSIVEYIGGASSFILKLENEFNNN
ncbi:glutaredoxin [uncultured bacterium]|nr:glutaredoxin [uncultured bacterium]